MADDNYLPIQPITQYIEHLQNLGQTSITISTSISHLKLYWKFLQDARLDWTDVNLTKLINFAVWLQEPTPCPPSIQFSRARRSERTITQVMATVYRFYDFHHCLGNVKDLHA
jgi:integrase/recombinase XerD